MGASKIAQYALIETSHLPECYSRHLSFSTLPDNESFTKCVRCRQMVALAWGTTLRSGGVRVSVWTRPACVKTSGPFAAHRRAPWNMGNKQRGLRQFRFRPSGIVVWATQAREAELREAGARQSVRGLRIPLMVRGP